MSNPSDEQNKLRRRDFLRLLGGGALALAAGDVLAGCGGGGVGGGLSSGGGGGGAGGGLSNGGGGGGGTPSNGSPMPTTGRGVFTINWPGRSRLIPDASNSVLVMVKQGTVQVGQELVPRPMGGGTSTATFDSLPVGTLIATCTAYPNADGTGTAQASGNVALTITVGETTAFTITMGSTVDHLEMTIPAAQIVSGTTTQATTTAKDATGAVVLTTPGKFQWTSSEPTIASVDAKGLVTGALAGSASITVMDTESGKSVASNITVLIGVTVQPNAPTLTLGQAQTFTATVVGSANRNVIWSIREGPSGGVVTSSGVYTAPVNPGPYHVIATSQADPTRRDTATVLVQAGGASGTIQ